MSDLASKKCIPCHGGVPTLKETEIESMLGQVSGWEVVEQHHLKKTFTFPGFRQTLDFINRVGEIAEHEGHHPDICFGWGRAEVTIWTHAVNGLTENDFILAAKIDVQ